MEAWGIIMTGTTLTGMLALMTYSISQDEGTSNGPSGADAARVPDDPAARAHVSKKAA